MFSTLRFMFLGGLLGAIAPLLATEPTSKLATVKIPTITIPQLRTVEASFEAVQQATVSAQVSGRITEIAVDVDDFVQKGSVIIKLRDKEQQAAYNAAKARFDEAQAEYSRISDVFKRGLVAKAVLDSADAKLKSSQAALDQANETLENTRIRAPYSGIVVKRLVQVGEMAQVGMPLISGLSLEKLRAVVELPQSLIYDVRKYKRAWVMTGKDQQTKLAATSLTISSSADPQSHTFTIKLNLPAGDHGVYPGMSSRALFMVGEESQLVVPRGAVAHRGEVTGVYITSPTGLQFQQVRLGRTLDDDTIAVQAGLSVGDEVVLDPVIAAAVAVSQPKK
ncbi:MAG: efflux RND transporter periplasmic adaptor subunit [Gammaproteobacteria bacterium]|nr:efflux RND transporter periplasmic adaptor subunit [Gammaproteobacteria bacterium]